MIYKIGVFGSAVNHHKIDEKRVEMLVNELSKEKVVILTGACSGVPYQIASKFAEKNIEVHGYSPEIDLKNQKKLTPEDNLLIYKKLIFSPKCFENISDPESRKKYRNVISTATCDAGIIIAGRWGTLNEFTNLHDMGKVIGVLTKTGGIADELPKLCKKIDKKSKAKVFFNSNPKTLVKEVMNELKSRTKE